MLIHLTQVEYCYLMEFLKSRDINFDIRIKNKKEDEVIVNINDDVGCMIWEMLIDEVCYHFDINYEPTETGKLIESLIDKLYIP